MKLKVKIDDQASALDIPSMYQLPANEYSSYVEGSLFFVDHHEILRAVIGDYPVATTVDQVELLIGYLNRVAEKMRGGEY